MKEVICRQEMGGGVFLHMIYEPVQELVRCKDCKHRPKEPDLETYKSSFDLEFPDSRCPCECDDGFYSWYPDDNWFCGNGERKG